MGGWSVYIIMFKEYLGLCFLYWEVNQKKEENQLSMIGWDCKP